MHSGDQKSEIALNIQDSKSNLNHNKRNVLGF